MSTDHEKSSEFCQEHRHSLFFPLLLIAIGVLLLLGTLGVIPGGRGGAFLKYWPVLLIIIGLDGFYKHDGGYVGSTLFLGMGVIFLLGNLNYLEVTPWQVALQFWPVLLVAVGLDLIVGRRSFLSLIAGVALGLGLAAGIFWLGLASPFRSGEEHTTPIQQEIQDAGRARLNVEPLAGELNLASGANSSFLVEGSLTSIREEEIHQTYALDDGRGIYRLEGSEHRIFPFFMGPSYPYHWNLELTSLIPLELETQMVAGRQEIQFDGLDVEDLKVETVMGETVLVFSEENDFEGKMNGVFGSLVIRVPRDVRLHIVKDCVVCAIDVPTDFAREEDDIWSPGAQNGSQVELRVDMVFGSLQVEYLP